MITEDDIKRINELHHKSKNEGLTEEEKLEQQKLRAAYIETMRNHIRTHLDNVVIQRLDGSREKLKKKTLNNGELTMGINDKASVKAQYNTSNNLSTRISIHDKYSTNKQGFGNWITSHYEIETGMKVLELGCGTGSMWVGKGELIKKCSKLILSDFSEGMLEKTKETLGEYEGIEYQVIDIQDIPYLDNTFDIVIGNMMLYHVPDLYKGLSEVSRVLKDGGKFYCATYGENGIMEYVYGLFADHGVEASTKNTSFTLQNGAEKLSKVFPKVTRYDYVDSLEVTNLDDLADYVYSLTGMSELKEIPRETMLNVFKENSVDGVLRVPKDYGMFVAEKEQNK